MHVLLSLAQDPTGDLGLAFYGHATEAARRADSDPRDHSHGGGEKPRSFSARAAESAAAKLLLNSDYFCTAKSELEFGFERIGLARIQARVHPGQHKFGAGDAKSGNDLRTNDTVP
jgi:hypothetical protein